MDAFDTCLQGDAQEEAAPALHTLRDQTRNFPTSLPISVDQADPSAHLQEVSRKRDPTQYSSIAVVMFESFKNMGVVFLPQWVHLFLWVLVHCN